MKSYFKTPAEVLDYGWDWLEWLDGATIVSATHFVPAGLTLDSESSGANTTTVWLSGGTARESYIVVCRITDSGGRTAERSFTIRIVPHR